MFWNSIGSDLSVNGLREGIAIYRSALELAPDLGSPAERAEWLGNLGRADQLADKPRSFFARVLKLPNQNLGKAKDLYDGVTKATKRSGLFIAGLEDGLSANAARFRENIIPGERTSAQFFVLAGGKVRKEYPSEKAERLVEKFFSSEDPSHQSLVALLDRSFAAHIKKLDRMVAQMEQIALTDKIAIDPTYPRYFKDAYPTLMKSVQKALIELNDGDEEISMNAAIAKVMSFLNDRQLEREGIDWKTAVTKEVITRGFAIAVEIFHYSAFQLLCLLIQIKKGTVDGALVEELKHAIDGRVITAEMAFKVNLRWEHLLEASRLIGNIDIIHANIDVALALAWFQLPHMDKRLVELQVRAAVARLGQATGDSRYEYDIAIKELGRLEGSYRAGARVFLLKPRT